MKNEDFTRGFNFADGASCCILNRAAVLVLIGIAAYVALQFLAPTDSTDESAWHRSGLRLYRDAATGVEHLGDGHGGLVRREK